jgi:hypothetical protein
MGRRLPLPFRSAALTLLPMVTLALAACGAADRSAALVPKPGEPVVTVMDFSRPLPLDPLPPGWQHRKFWTRRPMDISFAEKDGVPAIRLATRGSASMLFRHVDVKLADYPVLAWRWYVERPIESPIDERTRDGDDHPARIFLTFTGPGDARKSMEIIWGNKVLHAGDTKVIGGFPHYVANGGNENVGRWHAERVDLRDLTRRFWPGNSFDRIIDVALFCDSDETHTASVAYFADVKLERAP